MEIHVLYITNKIISCNKETDDTETGVTILALTD